MGFFDRYYTTRQVRDPYTRDEMRDVREPNMLKIVAHVLAAVTLLLTVLWVQPFHIVPTGMRGVVTQFGAIKGIEPEGLVVLPPWQKLALFNTRAEEAKVDKAEGATADTQPVEVSMMVRYAINTDKVAEVFEKYSKTGDLTSYVNTAAHETFKAVTAQYTAPDLISKRRLVSGDVFNMLNQKLSQYGARVINIDLTNFAFSKDYMAAINDKVTQEQKKLAAENEARTVEAQQRKTIVIAEAAATAAKAKADGEAYAKITVAKADADALRLQNAAIRESRDVLELKRIEVAKIEAEKWNGVRVPSTQLVVSPTPIMNVK